MDVLVGYTGFVGSNLEILHDFDLKYNSKNIKEAFGTNPDLLVYSGVPAQKFIANKFPEKDKNVIDNAIENIKQINPKTLVLISTIDVYKTPVEVDENTKIETAGLHAYGLNRFILEEWARDNKKNFEKLLIVRLPGLYGKNLKKNFIYDLINIIPSMLNKEKFEELSKNSELIKKHYILMDNGFYKCDVNDKSIKEKLKTEFLSLGFTALNFTDSRAKFQFYNLRNLWNHIKIAFKNDIELLNLATYPVEADKVYRYVKGQEFKNIISRPVPNYDFKTIHSEVFGKNGGYIESKENVLADIKEYIKNA